jgi:hypothetical protein
VTVCLQSPSDHLLITISVGLPVVTGSHFYLVVYSEQRHLFESWYVTAMHSTLHQLLGTSDSIASFRLGQRKLLKTSGDDGDDGESGLRAS